MMGELARTQTSEQAQAAVAERTAAESALAASAAPDPGLSGDRSAAQVTGGRGLEFNPNDAAAGQQAGAQPVGGAAAASTSGVDSEYQGTLDYAKSRGVDTSGYSDDAAFMDALLQRHSIAQQTDYYAALGRQFLEQAPELQRRLTGAPAAAAPTPAAPPEWEAPPYNEAWAQMVERDPASGFYLGRPGTPPEIVTAVNKYVDYQKKYASNPLAAVRPYVEQTVPDMINKAVEQRLAAYQREQTTRSIIAQNAPWMYQQNPQGQVQFGVTGQPVPTPAGMRYMNHVQRLESLGVKDPSAVDQLARQLTAAELHAANASQHQAGKVPANQQQAALASGRPQQNVLQSLGFEARQATNGATEPNGEGLSLREQMMRALAEFPETDFQDLDAMR
jgi:hypothetical protein